MNSHISYCLNLCNQTFLDIMSRENIEDFNKRFKHPSSHTRSRLTDFDGRARYLHEAAARDKRDSMNNSVRKSTSHLDKEEASDTSSTDTSWRITEEKGQMGVSKIRCKNAESVLK